MVQLELSLQFPFRVFTGILIMQTLVLGLLCPDYSGLAPVLLLLFLLHNMKFFQSAKLLDAIRRDQQGNWLIHLRAGPWRAAKLEMDSLVWPGLVVLHFSTQDGVDYTIVVDRSSVMPPSWCLLRRSLKLKKQSDIT